MADNPHNSANKPGTPVKAVAMILVTFGEAELTEWSEKPMALGSHLDS